VTVAFPPVRLLADGRGGEIRVQLEDAALLFSAQEARPLDGQHDDRPGIAVILGAMKLAWPPRDGRLQRLAIELPMAQQHEATEVRIRDAITAYCDHQIALAAIAVRLQGKERRRVWQVGLLFLVLFLGLSLLVAGMGWLPDPLRSVLQGSLVIAGWVGLWRPLELTLYEWWPERFRLGLHNHLRQMPVGITYY